MTIDEYTEFCKRNVKEYERKLKMYINHECSLCKTDDDGNDVCVYRPRSMTGECRRVLREYNDCDQCPCTFNRRMKDLESECLACGFVEIAAKIRKLRRTFLGNSYAQRIHQQVVDAKKEVSDGE